MKSQALQFPIGWSQHICIQDLKILLGGIVYYGFWQDMIEHLINS